MLYKNAFKKIRKSLGRYISLLIIIMVGVGFFSGVQASPIDIVRVADRYYKSNSLMLFKIVSTMGLTDDDVAVIKGIDGVQDAIPSYSLDLLNGTNVIRVHALEDAVNTVNVTKGRLPKLANECVADSSKFKIGDVIELAEEQKEEDDSDTKEEEEEEEDGKHIKNDRFTVVGLTESALYLSDGYGSTSVGSGKLYSYIFISKDNFDLEAYTEIYVVAEADDITAYSKEYDALVKRLNDKFVNIKTERESARHDEIYNDAMETIGEKEAELNDEKAKAEQELADAKQELEDGERELWEGKVEGVQELADAKIALREGELELEYGKKDGQRELDDAKKLLEDGEQELQDGQKLAEEEFKKGKKELDDGWQELWDGKLTGEKELSDARKKLEDGQKELDEGREYAEKEFDIGKRQLDDGMKELLDGKRELAENEAMLDEIKREQNAEFDEARRQIDEGWAQIDEGLAEVGITREQVGPMVEALDSAMEYLTGLLDTMPPGAGYDMIQQMIDDSAEQMEQFHQLADAIETLSESERQLDEGIALFSEEMAKADTEIAKAKATLAAGEKELEDGYKEYYDNLEKFHAEMEKGEKEIADGIKQYEDGKKEFNTKISDGLLQILEGYQEYYNNLVEYNTKMAKGKKELADGRKEYEDGVAVFNAEIADGEAELADGRQKYEDGVAEFEAEIADAEVKIADGKREYEEGLAEFEAEIADAEVKIMDAKNEVADLEHPKWYILSRSAVAGYSDLGSAVAIVSAVATVLPILFILIALFITSNSMNRMIVEERGELGTLVSLGYSNGKIISTYLLYVLSATGLGTILGYFIGCRFIPPLIYSNFGWILPPLDVKYNFVTLGLIMLFTFAMMSAVTVYTCLQELKHKPSHLMRPLPPRGGQKILLERIGVIWKRFSFTWKITVRNMFRYKKRGIMTILGMAGCTALLMIGFGIRDSMAGMATQQYGNIFTYNTLIILKDETAEIGGELKEQLEQAQVKNPLPVYQNGFTCENSHGSTDFYLIVPQNKAGFDQYFHLTSKLNDKAIELGNDSVVITQRTAKVMKLKKGDPITIKNADNESFELTVTDVAKNYASSYMYINPNMYYEVFGKAPMYNTVISNYEGEQAALSDYMTESGLSLNVTFTDEITKEIEESTGSLDGVVVLIVVVAALLAIVVLYNLTAINISERSREIATLKVLGFRDGEANTYIYREALVLSLLSVAIGLLLGLIAHNAVLGIIEVGAMSMHKRIAWISYVLSGAITMLISFVMQIITYLKLKKIDMIAALKSVE